MKLSAPLWKTADRTGVVKPEEVQDLELGPAPDKSITIFDCHSKDLSVFSLRFLKKLLNYLRTSPNSQFTQFTIHFLLKLPFGRADELCANSKNQGPERRENEIVNSKF